MARVCPLFSGSSGNSLFIGSAREGVLVDVGVSAKRIEVALCARGIAPESIRAVCITHEHRDHIAGLRVLTKRFGWPVCGTVGTLEAIAAEGQVWPGTPLVPLSGRVSAGSLTVTPFATSHDSRESCGYVVELPDEQRVAVATDTGVVTPDMYAALLGCDYVYIESNHDPDMLWNGPYPYYLKQRVASDRGHLPNTACAGLLPELVRRGTTRFTLAHLSQENNTPRLALDTATAALAQAGMVAGVDYVLTAAAPEAQEDVTVF